MCACMLMSNSIPLVIQRNITPVRNASKDSAKDLHESKFADKKLFCQRVRKFTQNKNL